MQTEREALSAAIDALEEIALAGMSGTGQETKEGMRDWHAHRAWEFIRIAARALEPARTALASAVAAEPVGEVYTMEALVPGGGVKHHVALRKPLPAGTKLYAAPFSNPQAQRAEAPVVVRLGAAGSAYDTPDTKRAYTYEHQPGNVIAYRLGEASARANAERGGDYIDGGLALLKALADKGLGVFALGAEFPSPEQGDGNA